jgi:hypothetical protein
MILTFLIAWFVVPVPKNAVLQAIKEAFPLYYSTLRLLTPPTELAIPSGMHPVLVSNGFDDDIRQTVLQLKSPLLGSAVTVPYVGKGSSSTPLSAPIVSYLLGTDEETNKYLYALAPNLVVILFGSQTRLGEYAPDNAAYAVDTTLADGTKVFASNSAWAAVPNFITGPGVYIENVDMWFTTLSTTETMPRYNATMLKKMINQPQILNLPLELRCQRNTCYFNNASAEVTFRTGNVTMGDASTPSTLGTFRQASQDGYGHFEDVQGFSACAQMVGYDTLLGQDCEEAAASVDPAAL